jgi:hypothetical protein
MTNTNTRKVREDLTQEEKDRLEKFGSIEFRSNRRRRRSHAALAVCEVRPLRRCHVAHRGGSQRDRTSGVAR